MSGHDDSCPWDLNDPNVKAYMEMVNQEIESAPYGRDSDGEPISEHERNYVLKRLKTL